MSSTPKLLGLRKRLLSSSDVHTVGRKAWEDLSGKLGAKFDIESQTAQRSEKIMIAANAIYESLGLSNGVGGTKRKHDDASGGRMAVATESSMGRTTAKQNTVGRTRSGRSEQPLRKVIGLVTHSVSITK